MTNSFWVQPTCQSHVGWLGPASSGSQPHGAGPHLARAKGAPCPQPDALPKMMDRYSDSYRGYWIEATLDESWVVRIRPTIADLPPVGISTFVMPRSFSSLQVFNDARARIDRALNISHENDPAI
jgi:hypothetical protein